MDEYFWGSRLFSPHILFLENTSFHSPNKPLVLCDTHPTPSGRIPIHLLEGSMKLKGRIAKYVLKLSVKVQFCPWTTKTTIFILKLLKMVQFSP
jgi:hypothetical protein